MKSRAVRASLVFALNLSLAAGAAAQTRTAEVPLPERLLAAIDVPLTLDTIERAGLTEAVALRVLGDGARTRYERLRAASAPCGRDRSVWRRISVRGNAARWPSARRR